MTHLIATEGEKVIQENSCLLFEFTLGGEKVFANSSEGNIRIEIGLAVDVMF